MVLRTHCPPIGLRFLDHARDQVNIDLGKLQFAGEGVGAGDFLAVMGAAVDLQDVVVEIFHAKAQAGHAHLADGVEFVAGQRARFALEGDFLAPRPRKQFLHSVGRIRLSWSTER